MKTETIERKTLRIKNAINDILDSTNDVAINDMCIQIWGICLRIESMVDNDLKTRKRLR